MATVAAVRFSPTTALPVLIGVQGTAVWLLLPSWPLAAVAFWRRRYVLGAVAAGAAAAQLTCALLGLGHGGPVPPVSAGSLRLVTSNILLDNPDIPTLSERLAATGADVVLLQEVTPEHAADLEGTPLWNDFPYRALDPLPGFHGSALFSKYPLSNSGPFDVAGSPMLRATVTTPAGPLTVINVHTVAPLDHENAVRWAHQLQELSNLARTAPGPLVMAGDFNATLDHGPLRHVIGEGMQDAFSEAGHGWGATWPRWDAPSFPLMRLDHVMVSASVQVDTADTQAVPGSDHLGLNVLLGMTGQR